MLSVVLGDEAEALSLPNPVGPTILSADDLTGDFTYWAVDAGTTPMSELAKQNSLERRSWFSLERLRRKSSRRLSARMHFRSRSWSPQLRSRSRRLRKNRSLFLLRTPRMPVNYESPSDMPRELRELADRQDEMIGEEVSDLIKPPDSPYNVKSGEEVSDLIKPPDSPYNVKSLNQLAKAVEAVARVMGIQVEAEEYNEPQARLDNDLSRFLMMIATAAEDYGQPLPVSLEEIRGDNELTAIAAHLLRLSKDGGFEEFLDQPIAEVAGPAYRGSRSRSPRLSGGSRGRGGGVLRLRFENGSLNGFPVAATASSPDVRIQG
jgi:hypothetical protein